MEDYLAHSAKMEYPAQTYLAHIQGVDMRAVQYAKDVEQHAKYLKNELHDIVHDAACLHDLGKLETENQMVLRGHGQDQRHLPINHVDAGSAALVKNGYGYAALAVYSHHKGLPNMQAESMRETAIFRDEHIKVRQHTDSVLSDLLQCHQSVFLTETCKEEQPYPGEISVFIRMVLSCLADADHTDTAVTYGKAVESELPALRAEERLAALDQYVSKLEGDDERNRLRREMYLVCRNARINSDFSSCDSPVGSGKTTAVMAHLLQQAIKRNARHIFVILPYTSIIQQSVDIYRKALLLPGEDPEAVVAELHSRADFQNYNTRYLTSLWRAPIVVTTAVAFFETLASNRPSALRRFHELPGSVIFIDEAHNALPLKLLPIAWNWMNVLAEEWNCYWTLASGSLVRYWELKPLSQVGMKHPCVEELVYADLQKRLMMYEKSRIRFCFQEKPVTRKKLIEWIHSAPGPRLLIVNTVQSAAVLADDFLKRFGRSHVEHLSTALKAEDREREIEKIKRRLENRDDTDWVLVATSCVEAGVNFSFRTGFRELSSLLSLLQAAGRVNRHGDCPGAEMWSFTLQEDSMLKENTQLNTSRDVLRDYFLRNEEIRPELSTYAMDEEIVRDDSCLRTIQSLMTQEAAMQFQNVAKEFKVIDSDTVTAVVDESLAKEIACGKGNWRLLQKKSISISRNKIKQWNVKEIVEDIFQWTLAYDEFLGYMRGVLEQYK